MIETKWEGLQSKLEACHSTLSKYHDFMSVFAEMNDCLADIAQIEVSKDSLSYIYRLFSQMPRLQYKLSNKSLISYWRTMSLCLSVCLPVCLFVCLSVSVNLSVSLFLFAY